MSLYSSIYRRILWPGYECLRRRQTIWLYQQSRRLERQSLAEIRAFQWQELHKVLRHAQTNSPWHRQRFATLQLNPADIRTPEDFQQIPTIGKAEIREHRDAMVATSFHGQLYSERTGGSTGVPMHYFYNRASYEWRIAVSMRGYAWAGCEDGGRQFYLWGEPIGTPSWKTRFKTNLHNAFLARRMFSSFRLDGQTLRHCVQEINSYQPITIIGYTNALFLLAQHILDAGTLRHKPTGVITAAEGVNALQRDIIQRAFGAPVFASYGSREFMLIGMECAQHNGFHLSADNLFVETVNGEIVITDLHNFGMPIIRYRIGDLGVLSDRQCSCGIGLPLLERVEGRVLDMIRTPDGRTVPGEFFPHLMKEFESVRQFQVIQKQLNLLQIKLVLRNGNPIPRLEQEIRQRLGDNVRLDFQTVADIPVGTNGKFRVTISELK